MYKVKIIESSYTNSLEHLINEFLDTLDEEYVFVDLKYSTSISEGKSQYGSSTHQSFSATIIMKYVYKRKVLVEKLER